MLFKKICFHKWELLITSYNFDYMARTSFVGKDTIPFPSEELKKSILEKYPWILGRYFPYGSIKICIKCQKIIDTLIPIIEDSQKKTIEKKNVYSDCVSHYLEKNKKKTELYLSDTEDNNSTKYRVIESNKYKKSARIDVIYSLLLALALNAIIIEIFYKPYTSLTISYISIGINILAIFVWIWALLKKPYLGISQTIEAHNDKTELDN